ncbi:MAG: hypothetical protein NPIRA01_21900 [Nitrospirales bacterium]|nr:MAG: hypothetical protein NPIRA01_21900 [Nitrospirales bacterium]
MWELNVERRVSRDHTHKDQNNTNRFFWARGNRTDSLGKRSVKGHKDLLRFMGKDG